MHINKRILVTGGCGFIGSHLCRSLLNQDNNEILCLDNCFTGTKRNIRDLLNHNSFEFIRHDITFPIHLEVDQIYNLACPASPTHYQYDPVKTIRANVHGAINVLNLAKRTKAIVLQTSTSEIYGDPEVHPQSEKYWGRVNPIGIRACYDEGKRCAETLFFDYYRQYNTKIKVARIFNTYGPYMHPNDGRVISNFIIQALKNEHIIVYGNGKQTRSFCYIDDMINGLVKLMNSRNELIGPINLGNPIELTILELAEKIIDFIRPTKTKIVYMKLPQDDPIRRKPDITLAKKELDWKPTISLEEGLNRTIDYFDELLKGGKLL